MTALKEHWEVAPPLNNFSPKCTNLDILEHYKSKPNGSAHIIMDMSWPRDVFLWGGEPCQLNEGMKNFNEYETVLMTPNAKFWSGWPCEVMKTDWSIAYKQVSVHREIHQFQLVECGGGVLSKGV